MDILYQTIILEFTRTKYETRKIPLNVLKKAYLPLPLNFVLSRVNNWQITNLHLSLCSYSIGSKLKVTKFNVMDQFQILGGI